MEILKKYSLLNHPRSTLNSQDLVLVSGSVGKEACFGIWHWPMFAMDSHAWAGNEPADVESLRRR